MEYVLKKEDGKKVTVRDVQEHLLDMLKEVDRICKKRNIPYFLDGGTALGAYRHKGFIPWDDDLDIGVRREDYPKFIQAMKEELDDSYVAQCFELDSRYNVLCPAMKIRKKNTFILERTKLLSNLCPCDGIFLDVFVYDNVSSNLLVDFFFHFLECILLCFIVFVQNLYINPRLLKSCYVKLAHFYGRLCKKSSYMGYELTWNFSFSHLPRYKKKDMFPTIDLPFEDGVFPVPGNITTYLGQAYGKDYMTPKKPIFSGDSGKHIIDICLENDNGSKIYKKSLRRRGILLKGGILTIILLIISICLFNELSFIFLGMSMIIFGITLLLFLN